MYVAEFFAQIRESSQDFIQNPPSRRQVEMSQNDSSPESKKRPRSRGPADPDPATSPEASPYTDAQITGMIKAMERLVLKQKKDSATEQFNAAMKSLNPDEAFIDNTDKDYYVATPCAPQASAVPATEHQSITRKEFAKITKQNAEGGGGAPAWQIQVDHYNEMLWAIPKDLADAIIRQWQKGNNKVKYIWIYKNHQWGTFKHEEKGTSISRYSIDLDNGIQTNLDTEKQRKVQLVQVI